MGRLFRWFKSLFNRFMDNVEDPELLLDQAKRDMQETLVANRERAVQAITQKNRLQNMLDEQVKKAEKLESQATMALQQGNRELARSFMREKASADALIVQLRGNLEQATATVETVKLAIKRQEEEVRKKTAEALAMKAQWKQAQIQNSIAKALEGLTFENQIEGFGAAAEKIKDAQAEASARQEMLGTSLQGKVMEMEDKAIDMQAEADLQALEARLGMRETPVTTAAAVDTPVSVGGGAPAAPENPDAAAQALLNAQADAELDELEKRLKGGS